jgi:hypothetical protein
MPGGSSPSCRHGYLDEPCFYESHLINWASPPRIQRMHSVGALEFLCTYNRIGIRSIYAEVCVTRGNKTIFLNRLGRPNPVEASFDDSDFPRQTDGTSPQLLQDFVLQGFCKWKLRLLQVTLHCVTWLADRQRTFCFTSSAARNWAQIMCIL